MLVSQHDGMPRNESLPTSAWLADETVRDEHALGLPPDLAGGDYQLEVGLYSAGSMERLSVMDASGNPTGNSVSVGPVTLIR
jgi:hypothetical protein